MSALALAAWLCARPAGAAGAAKTVEAVPVRVEAPAPSLPPAAVLPAAGTLAQAPILPEAAVPGLPLSVEPTRPRGPVQRVGQAVSSALRAVGRWVFPEVVSSADAERGASGYYHGTSVAKLFEAAEDGGALKADLTFVSDGAGFPFGYARSSARKTGTTGVLLHFPETALDGKLVPGHWSPGIPATPTSPPQIIENFYRAVSPLSLSEVTPETKAAILERLRKEREESPGDPEKAERLAAIARAFGLPEP